MFPRKISKQFQKLAGQPIILHAIKKLITSPLIRGGVIVCGTEDIKKMQDILSSVKGFRKNLLLFYAEIKNMIQFIMVLNQLESRN
jgi:2-C-methyl-D-erythritol 4-phosphate cytidylyltransferase